MDRYKFATRFFEVMVEIHGAVVEGDQKRGLGRIATVYKFIEQYTVDQGDMYVAALATQMPPGDTPAGSGPVRSGAPRRGSARDGKRVSARFGQLAQGTRKAHQEEVSSTPSRTDAAPSKARLYFRKGSLVPSSRFHQERTAACAFEQYLRDPEGEFAYLLKPSQKLARRTVVASATRGDPTPTFRRGQAPQD